jgi:N-acetylmuramoyl-L-alanine amidase
MSKRWHMAILILLILLPGCLSEENQEQLQTRAAKAGQTAIAEGNKIAQTQAALLKKTAVAEVGTQVARHLGGDFHVALDPGHGWLGAPGASGHGMLEKDVALDIAFRTKAILEGQGFLVTMTRTGDDLDHSLEYAAEMVNEQNPDIVVSVHANAGGGTGTEACFTVGKDTDSESKLLAGLLADSISSKLSLTNRGIFPENAGDRCARRNTTGWDQLYIHNMNPPAALAEVAFIDNANDAELLTTRRQDFAQAIADSVVAYFQTDLAVTP